MPVLLFLLPIAAMLLYLRAQNAEAVPAVEAPAPSFDFGAPDFSTVAAADVPAPDLDTAASSAAPGVAPAAGVFDRLMASVKTAWQIPARGLQYAEPIANAESRYGLPPNLLARQLYQESAFRSEVITGAVRSSAGAVGIAQFMPATANDLGVDPLNPLQAIDAAARYMRQLYDRFGDWALALAAYNWGQGNVAKKGIAAAPAETRNYVQQITADVPIG